VSGGRYALRGRLVEQHLERESHQRISSDDGVADPVLGPKRRPVTPFRITIDDVVVDERKIVNKLYRRRTRQTSAFGRTTSRCRR
jgi:hypothetical protein